MTHFKQRWIPTGDGTKEMSFQIEWAYGEYNSHYYIQGYYTLAGNIALTIGEGLPPEPYSDSDIEEIYITLPPAEMQTLLDGLIQGIDILITKRKEIGKIKDKPTKPGA